MMVSAASRLPVTRSRRMGITVSLKCGSPSLAFVLKQREDARTINDYGPGDNSHAQRKRISRNGGNRVAFALSRTAPAAAAPAKPPTTADVIASSKPSDWHALDPQYTLYLNLPAGRVVIELAPAFAPNHVKNIKALVAEKYFDGLEILRSQDNYVVQWGDPHADARAQDKDKPRPIKNAQRTLKAEFTIPQSKDLTFTPLPDRDGYAPQTGFSGDFPAARDPKTNTAWMTHCYGTVGVGRDLDSDSGGGTELYVVIGNSPRWLDRNITVVGRVVQGIEILSTMPRGTGALGFTKRPNSACRSSRSSSRRMCRRRSARTWK